MAMVRKAVVVSDKFNVHRIHAYVKGSYQI
jgi:hypothetical protein